MSVKRLTAAVVAVGLLTALAAGMAAGAPTEGRAAGETDRSPNASDIEKFQNRAYPGVDIPFEYTQGAIRAFDTLVSGSAAGQLGPVLSWLGVGIAHEARGKCRQTTFEPPGWELGSVGEDGEHELTFKRVVAAQPQPSPMATGTF